MMSQQCLFCLVSTAAVTVASTAVAEAGRYLGLALHRTAAAVVEWARWHFGIGRVGPCYQTSSFAATTG